MLELLQRPHSAVLRLLALVGVALALVAPMLAAAPPASGSLVGELSGTVTGGGRPLANLWVTITPVTETGARTGSAKRVLTDGDGVYRLPEVYDRRVKVHVRAPAFGAFVDTFWPAAHSFAQAGTLEISSWPVVADVDLPEGGSVSGQVIDQTTGSPVQGARVTAYLATRPAAGPFGMSRGTPAPGGFQISGVPPGEVRLRVTLPPESPYLVPSSRTSSESTIQVRPGRTTTAVVLRLQRGAEIRGTVRDDRGQPVAGATVKLIGCHFACPLLVTTDGTGAYRIPAIRPGSHLGVVAWRTDDLLRQWYPQRDSPAQASDISLGAGEVLDSVDFRLTRAAFLTLEVSDTARNEPVSAIVLLRRQGSGRNQYFQGTTPRPRTAGDGDGPAFSVRFGPLPPGPYEVLVDPGSANPGYLRDRWVASGGVDADGSIQLSPGADARAVVGLIPAPPTPAGGAPADPGGTATWPGLAQGFLSGPALVGPPPRAATQT